MSELCKETLCTSCIHLNVCAIKDDCLKIFETLPKHDDNFSLKVCCKHYIGSTTTKLHNSKSNETMNDFLNYGTKTGNLCGSKTDI